MILVKITAFVRLEELIDVEALVIHDEEEALFVLQELSYIKVILLVSRKYNIKKLRRKYVIFCLSNLFENMNFDENTFHLLYIIIIELNQLN